MDWMLPDRDGPAICRAVRNARLPLALLMLTARGQVEDRVIGLDNGADDYLVKPFAFEELLARVRALSRRFAPAANGSDPMELRCGDITLDVRAHTMRRGNVGVSLTTTEWEVLECLMRHPYQALSREQIFRQVWSYDSQVQVTIVDLYISYLRHKLQVTPEVVNPIETVRGVGYRLNVR
jgi:DNA-binding response OmpR family regulator